MTPEDEARVREIVNEELQREREDNRAKDVGYEPEYESKRLRTRLGLRRF